VRLFAARGPDFDAVCRAADELRQRVNGDEVSYVVTRNINYTNVCYFRCQFCAFSKGKLSENLRGRPYDLDMSEIQRRVEEAWERGATEVCLQGGIHPDYTAPPISPSAVRLRRWCRDPHPRLLAARDLARG
jgi:FO synthase